MKNLQSFLRNPRDSNSTRRLVEAGESSVMRMDVIDTMHCYNDWTSQAATAVVRYTVKALGP